MTRKLDGTKDFLLGLLRKSGPRAFSGIAACVLGQFPDMEDIGTAKLYSREALRELEHEEKVEEVAVAGYWDITRYKEQDQ